MEPRDPIGFQDDPGECDCGSDEKADQCVGCTTNAECDDEVFCNGTETCNAGTNTCVGDQEPCLPEQTCVEVLEQCADPGTFLLTPGIDLLIGSPDVDFFDAQLRLDAGAFVQTLNNSDELNGDAGIDTLSAQLLGGGTLTPTLLAQIENVILGIVGGGAKVVDLSNADSVVEVDTVFGTDALTVQNIPTVPTGFRMISNSQDFIVSIADAALGD